MTINNDYYRQEVLRIRAALYPDPLLVERVTGVARLIERDYPARLGLKDLAGKAFLSRFHFVRVFRKMYGRTPGQYLSSVRMAEAKRLLASGTGVKEVCEAVGFESVASFSTLFRRMTGVSPAAYQRSQKHRRSV